MIIDINKFKIEQVKAINFIFFSERPLSLLTKIANTPIIGIKSKDDNNIYKSKRIRTSVSYRIIMYHHTFNKHHKYIKVIDSINKQI